MPARSRLVRSLTITAVAFAAASRSGVAAADPPAPPSAADLAAAERLFEEARTLLAAGSYTEACTKFAASQKIDPAVGTLLNLADCYERNGQTASAWATYRQAETAAEREGQKPRVEFAASNAARLEPKLGKLVVVVPPAARVRGLVVESDDHPLPPGAWGAAIPNDPGQHVIRAHADGRDAWSTTVSVEARKVREISVPVLKLRPVVADPRFARGAPRWQRPLGVAVGALGLVAIGFGSVYGVRAFSGYEEADTQHCTAIDCDAIGVRGIDSAQTDALVSTVLIGVGAAAVVTGVILLVTGAPAPRAASQSTGAGNAAAVLRW